MTDPVFFNKNIHRDELSSLVLILPAMMDNIPGYGEILDQIAERIDNVVCLEEPIKGWPTVIFDRALAARQAMEHLLSLGHERIGFLSINDARLTGYRQVLLDHQLPYDEDIILTPGSLNMLQNSYQATLKLIANPIRPTAIFTANDEMAVGAIAALHDQGLRVPEDMAIVSIDNIPLAEMVRPRLTTVNVPKRRMASLALQALNLEQPFSGQQSASIVLPTQLIIRDSCGANLGNK